MERIVVPGGYDPEAHGSATLNRSDLPFDSNGDRHCETRETNIWRRLNWRLSDSQLLFIAWAGV